MLSLPLHWIALALCYLLGSVPFGLTLGLVFKGVDIREAGSRNIGATNAGRVLGRPFALIAFAGDFAKGLLPTLVIGPALAGPEENVAGLAVLCAAAAVLGHVFPVYIRFKGGKAVATGCGAIVGIDPLIFLGGALTWLVAAGLFRMVGLASMAMCAAFPFLAAWREGAQPFRVEVGLEVVIGTTALALLVLMRHRANIARMLAGTEPKMGRGSRSDRS